MDDSLVRRIMPVGDLVDKLLINEIKISKLPKEQAGKIREENTYIQQAIELLMEDHEDPTFLECGNELADLLLRHWNLLDRYYDDGMSNEERGAMALEVQSMNSERTELKNRINALAGSRIEFKKYGHS